MKLAQLKVSNFRCYREETVLDIDDLTVLIGKNDAGKSSLFDALHIFFEAKPEHEDFNVHANKETDKMRITCVFNELPKEVIIDSDNSTTFENEYLLNYEKNLEIIKEYDFSAKNKKPKVFSNSFHPTTPKYNDLLYLTINKLKDRANELNVNVDAIDKRISSDLRKAIWESTEEKNLCLKNEEIDLNKEYGKQIWEEIEKYMPIFALFKSDRESTDQDDEAQNPIKTAVKEAFAIKEVDEQLRKIKDKVKKDVEEVIKITMEKIREMRPDLAEQLNPTIDTKPGDSLFTIKLTGDQDIPINKRGSGTRRLILLNFFRAQAEKESENSKKNVIYAFEEPETSQHPDNQVLLVQTFEELAEKSDCQVLFSTHTPMLARKINQNYLRFIADENTKTAIYNGKNDDVMPKIVDSLGVLPDHNVKVFWGVEGKNDIPFLKEISKILHKSNNDILDLELAENEGKLVFVPFNGSSLDLWAVRLSDFSRPEFYLVDGDDCPMGNHKYQKAIDKHISKRHEVWITEKRELENYLHKDAIIDYFNKSTTGKEIPKFEGKNDPKEDIPELFAMAVHNSSESKKAWNDLKDDAKGKKISKAKEKLNSKVVLEMTPERLKNIDKEDEVIGWLRKISEELAKPNLG